MKTHFTLATPSETINVLMLLTNAFDPDPRVYAEARALVNNGYAVRILAWDRDRKLPRCVRIDGIDVQRIHIPSQHGRGWTQSIVMVLVTLAMVLRGLASRFDVLHAHDLDTLPAGYCLSRLKRKPLVYDSHEDYAGMLHGNIPAWMERLLRRIESWLVHRVDLLITVGELLREQFERRGCRRSVVVGNWKKLEEYRLTEQDRRRVRIQLNIPERAVVIAFIANLGSERHIPELLSALKQCPQVHAVIGGKGSAAVQVEEAARQHPNIHYLGFVNPKDIGAYTWAADVVFYGFDLNNPNSQYSAPNKLFEALASGCAIITGNFGEIGRMVAAHHCGILLKDFSETEILKAIISCQQDTELGLWKLRAAYLGQHEYNWPEAKRRLLEAYPVQSRGTVADGDLRDAAKEEVNVP